MSMAAPAPVTPPVVSTLADRVAAYLGLLPGGVDLQRAIGLLPAEPLARFTAALAHRRGTRARVFFLGNGGSFDNARLMAALLRADGWHAQVPGQPDDYWTTAARAGYGAIYAEALRQDQLTADDLVVGISGSGNSPNVIAALELARERGAEAWCLGGRDGGRMRQVTGDAHALIAVNACMEAIEDLHVIALVVALDAIRAGDGVPAALARYRTAFQAFATRAACEGIGRLVQGMLDTIITGGRVFVLGTTIGASHIRADLGRGATNAIPVRGIAAPEFASVNAAQATANDDGLEFVLVDALVKFEPHPQDVAVLCALPQDRAGLSHCRELLSDAGTPMHAIGEEGILLDAFAAYGADSALATIGHICGEVIRAELHERWQARRLALSHDFPPGARKLGRRAAERLERDLRARGVLLPQEQLTFCYGQLYAVQPPPGAPTRCFY